jgi:hypothetical protein
MAPCRIRRFTHVAYGDMRAVTRSFLSGHDPITNRLRSNVHVNDRDIQKIKEKKYRKSPSKPFFRKTLFSALKPPSMKVILSERPYNALLYPYPFSWIQNRLIRQSQKKDLPNVF